jgi:dolichyl-diphosphooligosaccharide--protein glycosyltransferase
MHNHFVNGESADEGLGRYGYAPLFVEEEIDERLERLSSSIGYLVLTERGINISDDRDRPRLSDQLGLPDDRFESLERYRLIYVDEESDLAVFAAVEGARIEMEGVNGETVNVSTDVSVDDRTFSYTQQDTVNDEGIIRMTVPYPGTYEIGNQTVSVPSEAVEEGHVVNA